MKNSILLFALSLAFTAGIAQTNVYHPFPDSNAVWCEDHSYYDGTCDVTDHFAQFIDGDIIIDGISYHKLYRTGYVYSSLCGGGSNYFNQLTNFFREDIPNKKVYIYALNKDTLLYDFNLSLHDTLRPSYINNAVTNFVSSVDSLLVGNTYRKRFWLSTNSNSAYVALIEGMGSTFGLVTQLVPPFEATGFLYGFSTNVDHVQALAYCSINGIPVAAINTSLQVYPNPATTVLTVETGNIPDAKASLRIMNTTGIELWRKETREKITPVDIRSFEKGVYFIQYSNERIIETTKFIKY
jgi:hypothetical protein